MEKQVFKCPRLQGTFLIQTTTDCFCSFSFCALVYFFQFIYWQCWGLNQDLGLDSQVFHSWSILPDLAFVYLSLSGKLWAKLTRATRHVQLNPPLYLDYMLKRNELCWYKELFLKVHSDSTHDGPKLEITNMPRNWRKDKSVWHIIYSWILFNIKKEWNTGTGNNHTIVDFTSCVQSERGRHEKACVAWFNLFRILEQKSIICHWGKLTIHCLERRGEVEDRSQRTYQIILQVNGVLLLFGLQRCTHITKLSICIMYVKHPSITCGIKCISLLSPPPFF